jgi:hypothetical protein
MEKRLYPDRQKKQKTGLNNPGTGKNLLETATLVHKVIRRNDQKDSDLEGAPVASGWPIR